MQLRKKFKFLLMILLCLFNFSKSVSRKAHKHKQINTSIAASSVSVAPYDYNNALNLLTELSYVVLINGKVYKSVFPQILEYFRKESDAYQGAILHFWGKMSEVATGTIPWDMQYYQDALNTISKKNCSYKGFSSNCVKQLEFLSNPKNDKIMSTLNQETFFGGFNKQTTNPPIFIHGMASHHRDKLPSNFFQKLNEMSRNGNK
jgi:hypothetical protein